MNDCLKFWLNLVFIVIRPLVAMYCSFGILFAFLTMQPWLILTLTFLYAAYFSSWSAGKTLE